MSRKIDQFFKDGLKSISTPYQSKHWDEMSSILDDRNTSGRPGGLLWWIAGFVGISFALFLWVPSETSVASNDSLSSASDSFVNKNGIRDVEIDQIPALSDVRLHKTKSYSFGLSSNELNSYVRGNLVFTGDIKDHQRFSLSGSQATTNFGSDSPFSDMVHFASSTEIASSSESGMRLSALSALNLLDLDLLPSDKFRNLSSVDVDDSPRFFAPIRWGVGATYGGASFRDAGLFLELNIPLSPYFHLVFRPGVTYASLNESPVHIEQRLYDFGLKEKEIALNIHRELQWEVPVFLLIKNHRHHFGLGGGLRLDGLRRAERSESTLSDKDRLEGGEESYKGLTSREEVWLEPSNQIIPFIEGFYQYRLSPSWQAGLKSRVTLPSTSAEGSLDENRVHYGMYITYLLN